MVLAKKWVSSISSFSGDIQPKKFFFASWGLACLSPRDLCGSPVWSVCHNPFYFTSHFASSPLPPLLPIPLHWYRPCAWDIGKSARVVQCSQRRVRGKVIRKCRSPSCPHRRFQEQGHRRIRTQAGCRICLGKMFLMLLWPAWHLPPSLFSCS